jgi:hypothetical protein
LRAENTTQRGTLSIPTSIPPYTIYVANACGSNAIEAFQTTPNSGVPISAISGSATKLDAPVWLYDSTGNTLWAGSYDNQTVAVYRVGSNGNVAPVGTLEGANVGHPAGIARDANGNTYVADYTGNRILVFPIGASGSASPSRVITGAATGLAAPYGLIMDSTGDLIVTNAIGNSVETFASTASGNASPLRAIRGGSTQLDYPLGIALDHGGNVYVSNGRGNSVVRFAVASTGNVAPSVTIAGGHRDRLRGGRERKRRAVLRRGRGLGVPGRARRRSAEGLRYLRGTDGFSRRLRRYRQRAAPGAGRI